MSTCEAGDTTGFPLRISQSVFSEWPATTDSQGQIQKLTVPTDFTIQWGPPAGATIQVYQTATTVNRQGVFQVRGLNTVTDNTTLTFGTAVYKCSGVLSIVQNQHKNFTQHADAIYEAILAFQISNKQMNPSSPDVILLCRPIVFGSWNSSPLWSVIDEACLRDAPRNIGSLDLSTLYGYNSTYLMPMTSYQTCMPVKLLNYKGHTSHLDSIRIRVHVVPQPIYVVASENGLGKCTSVNKYTLITEPRNLVDVFDSASGNTIFQFRDGLGPDLYPNNATRHNFVTNASSSIISAFTDLINKIEILVPEAFLGKSLADIAKTSVPPAVQKNKKAFKCYTINPEKDIVGDQIMVDPTTGESLRDTISDRSQGLGSIDSPGAPSGVMPGDIEEALTTFIIVIGAIVLLSYLLYILFLVFHKENSIHDAFYHILIFIVLLVCLILFGIFVDK
jgi:hypothetical protein